MICHHVKLWAARQAYYFNGRRHILSTVFHDNRITKICFIIWTNMVQSQHIWILNWIVSMFPTKFECIWHIYQLKYNERDSKVIYYFLIKITFGRLIYSVQRKMESMKSFLLFLLLLPLFPSYSSPFSWDWV